VIHAAIVIGTLFGAYLFLWLGEYSWRLFIAAPKFIFNGCQAEVRSISAKSQADIHELRDRLTSDIAQVTRLHSEEIGKWAKNAVDMTNDLAGCREQLAKKNPHDTEKERQVALALTKLDEREREFLKWLLTAGTANNGEIQRIGHGRTPNDINTKISPLRLLTYDSFRPGNGTVEMDQFHKINPVMELALKNVLYPPS
jgi:hypothetical protein